MPAPGNTTVANPTPRGGWPLAGLLAFGLAARALGLSQPIVENYVGRQVPTAMVARNLDRGAPWSRPALDVAPFPNLFLVEPPIYAAAAVGLRRLTGLPLGPAGRLVSAGGVLAAAWGLYGLAAARRGRAVGLVATAAFLAFPVTVRYGRAFQPDALMLGGVVAGLRCWDESERGAGRAWLWAGVAALSAGLALKVTSAFVLVPLALAILSGRRGWKLGLAAACLVPALVWYAYASCVIGGPGSGASRENGRIWLRVLIPAALLRASTWGHIARGLGVRAFTPLGPCLALLGLTRWGPRDRLARVWGLSALASLAALAAKLHHEYYWLALAPVVAIGVGQALVELWSEGGHARVSACGIVAVGLPLCVLLSASTYTTPHEWRHLTAAAASVRARVPAGDWLVAPEALLYESDRRGCRLEFTPAAAARAAGEWGVPGRVVSPGDLVEFYRERGARYFADLAEPGEGPGRLALHDAVRRRYNVVIDRPGLLLAALHAPRT